MNEFDFQDMILSLIRSKREGDYWDFKQQHHLNKADLLHDILCMANSLNGNDCYIVFGVEDKTGDIVGVENDINRRNQQGIIDFLRSKKFAGDYRPTVELRIVVCQQHELDVLVVYDTLNTPFYLSQDYSDGEQTQRKIVRSNYIYTRIGDTNTPIDKSADIHNVEYLWKKRLGLLLTPFEQFCQLVNDKSRWNDSENYHYNELHPEFTISLKSNHPEFYDEYSHERYSPIFYSYVMVNASTSYDEVIVNYYGTTLTSCQTVVLDSGRLHITVPDGESIKSVDSYTEVISYRYYIKGSVRYLLRQYLYNEESHEALYALKRFEEAVLIFDSENERRAFIDYIKDDFQNVFAEINAMTLTEKCPTLEEHEQEPALSALKKELVTGKLLVKKLGS